MSVPCGDQRDYDFAKHFGIPIPNIFEGVDISEEAFEDKQGTVIANSHFLNGLPYKEAVKKVIEELEKIGKGKGKVNYRLRDAVFSRQRYWGEPFPVYYDADGLPQLLDEKYLPLELPKVEKYLPTETGDPPLGNATHWAWDTKQLTVVSNQLIDYETVFPLDLNTMPGWAGSSQYFNRYMDPHNDDEIFSQEAINYWQDVDLYIGGIEHATGHLLYSRFWQKFMCDKGWVPKDEYAKKLINQGMITGTSAFVYRVSHVEISLEEDYHSTPENERNHSDKVFPLVVFSHSLLEKKEGLLKIYQEKFDEVNSKPNLTTKITGINPSPIHADVSLVNSSNQLDIEAFKTWQPEYKDAIFILDSGETYDEENSLPSGEGRGGDFLVSREVEKMSKSKYNVVNPDDIVKEYGADSLRMYEMFLGPLEQSKPWNTAGITGVHSFLKKLWKLYHSGPNGEFHVTYSPSLVGGQGEVLEPSKENLKTLHKTIKKVEEDIENFSFNTSVATFMICVNELTAQKCNSREILEPLAILISPYAPAYRRRTLGKIGP